MSTSTPRTLPPEAGWYEERCPRCSSMEQELRRLRDERNDLVLELHEARRAPSAPRAVPAPAPPLATAPAASHPRSRGRRASTGNTLSSFPTRDAPTDAIVPTPVGAAQPTAGAVAPANQGIDFGAVANLSPGELDDLPYGLITLDAEGRVVHYNDTEARMAGFPKDRVVGRRFFGEVAPCARVREFEGRFEELVRDPKGVRVQTFDFVFRFDHSEQHVTIVMTPARRRGHYHLALVRRSVVAH